MREILRLFVAIEQSDTLGVALGRLQREIRTAPAAGVVRWVDPRNIHLTLKFLGNVSAERVDALTVALERAVMRITPFELSASGLGAFPNLGRPNNVWVGLDGDVQAAALLVRRIEDECASIGLARDDRGFNPHLTLGRVKRQATNAERAAVGRALAAIPRATYGTIHVASVHLISSDLYPTGPIYNTLTEIRLEV